jgi:two-component system, NarL family, response regulator NreC
MGRSDAGAERRTSVVLADDHLVVRAGLRALLAAAADSIVVVAESATVRETLSAVARHRPDVLLLDISLGGASSLPALADIRKAAPNTHTLVLTMHEDPAFVQAAFAGGALGYLLKDAAAGELVGAVRLVASGGRYLQRSLGARLATDPPNAQLTERERRILALLAAGYTNAEIAGRLYLGLRTVEADRASIRDKLGAESRADLVAGARRQGWSR